MTASSAKTAPVSLAGCGDVKNKQNTDGMGKSASALQWQREEMRRRRRMNHISRLTGGSQGKKCSFCLDLDSEACDSAVAYSLNVCVCESTRWRDARIRFFDCGVWKSGRKVGPSHLTLTSPVNVRHWAAILEALLWCSWAHKSRAAMSFSALSPAVSGSKCPWDCFCFFLFFSSNH